MFNFIKRNRPVSIAIVENSQQEKDFMNLIKTNQITNIECELGCLFGYITRGGEFVNKYIIKQKDFDRIHGELNKMGKLSLS